MMQHAEAGDDVHARVVECDVAARIRHHVARGRMANTIAPPLVRRLDGHDFLYPAVKGQNLVTAGAAECKAAPELAAKMAVTMGAVQRVIAVLIAGTPLCELIIAELLLLEPFANTVRIEVVAVKGLPTHVRFHRLHPRYIAGATRELQHCRTMMWPRQYRSRTLEAVYRAGSVGACPARYCPRAIRRSVTQWPRGRRSATPTPTATCSPSRGRSAQSNRLETELSSAMRRIASPSSGATVRWRMLRASATPSRSIESVITSSSRTEPSTRAMAPPDRTPCVH